MSTEMQLFNAGVIPAHLQEVFGNQQVDDLTSGAEASFPIISIKGKVWRIKQGADERVVQRDGQPLPTLDIVLVKANRNLSKLYYGKAYTEGDDSPPDCASGSGVTPDVGVPKPQSQTCAACPHNVWGSKITPQGTKTKMCSDLRRMAVVADKDLECKYYGAPFLIRIPAASLQSLSEYARVQLNGRPYSAVVTQIGFDMNLAFPKLTFKPIRWLTAAESQLVLRWQNDIITDRIIGAADLRPALPIPQPIVFDSSLSVEQATDMAIAQTTAMASAAAEVMHATQATPVVADPFSDTTPTQTITQPSIAQPAPVQAVDPRLVGVSAEMITAIMANGGPDSPTGSIILAAIRPPTPVAKPVDPLAGLPDAVRTAVMALGGPDSEIGKNLIAAHTPVSASPVPEKKQRKPRTPKTMITQTPVVQPVASPVLIPTEVLLATPAVTASTQIVPASDDMLKDVDALLAGLDNLNFDDI